MGEAFPVGSFPSFEAYVEAQAGGWTDGGECMGCRRAAPRLTVGTVEHGFRCSDRYCECCMQYQYGYDQAEARIARELLYGAARAALRADVSPSLIREAVDRAVDDQYDAEYGEAFRAGERVGR